MLPAMPTPEPRDFSAAPAQGPSFKRTLLWTLAALVVVLAWDASALDLAMAAWDVLERLGSPEGELALAQAVTFLACAAKSDAVYLAWGGPEGGLLAVHQWLTPHWQRSSEELLHDPDRHNWKSALQEWSQARGLGLPHYQCQQVSDSHGDLRRFHCTAELAAEPGAPSPDPQPPSSRGEGWGPFRRAAEQAAAAELLAALRSAPAG
jgi:ribonuclease-3